MLVFIMTIIFILLITLLFSPSLSTTLLGQYRFDLPTNIPNEDHKYQLIWEDEFDGDNLDSNSWNIIQRNNVTWGRYMSPHKKLYNISKGRIRLYTMRNTFNKKDTAQILTAGISTKHKRTFKYGKVEVRARIKGVQGSWPAIWTMPDNDRFADMNSEQRAEIDIMEYLNKNNYAYQTVHSHYIDIQKKEKIPQVKAKIKKNKYNTFAVEILPSKLIFSVNGNPTFVYEKQEPTPIGQYPFGIEQYLLIDMQFGGTWVKSIRPQKLPCYMDVEWVKIYKLIK